MSLAVPSKTMHWLLITSTSETMLCPWRRGARRRRGWRCFSGKE